jgi:hypothetical protein
MQNKIEKNSKFTQIINKCHVIIVLIDFHLIQGYSLVFIQSKE